MTRLAAGVLALVALGARPAGADAPASADAERAYTAAQARAAAGDPVALDALEALGRARPVTPWTDDAWAEAARLAERRADFARARRDLAEVVATAEDDIVRRRAEAALARLAATGGAHGEWDAIAASHARLAAAILGGAGDPKPALAELTALVTSSPQYPGATAARLVLAQGWERDGDLDRARAVLAEAIVAAPTPELRGRARYAAFHAAVHARALADARAQLDAIAAAPGADPAVVQQLADALASASVRAHLRLAALVALAAAAVLGAWRARREAGSWRAAARALVPPPLEVWYVAPLLVGLALIAQGGNPILARALRAIAAGGIALAWLSGASLRLAARRRPLGGARLGGHVLVVLAALASGVFLVVDRDRLLDLLAETWRSGPALP